MHINRIQPKTTQTDNANPGLLGKINKKSKEAFYLGVPTTNKLSSVSCINHCKRTKLKEIGITPTYRNYAGGVINANISPRYELDLVLLHEEIQSNFYYLQESDIESIAILRNKYLFAHEGSQRIDGVSDQQINIYLKMLGLTVIPKHYLRALVDPEKFCNHTLQYLGSMLLTMEANHVRL